MRALISRIRYRTRYPFVSARTFRTAGERIRDVSSPARFPGEKNPRSGAIRGGGLGPRECGPGKLVLTEFYAERTNERTNERWTSFTAVNEAHCTCHANAPHLGGEGGGGGSRDTHQPRAESQSLAGWPIASRAGRRRPPIMVCWCSQSEYMTISLFFSFSLSLSFPFPLVYD